MKMVLLLLVSGSVFLSPLGTPKKRCVNSRGSGFEMPVTFFCGSAFSEDSGSLVVPLPFKAYSDHQETREKIG